MVEHNYDDLDFESRSARNHRHGGTVRDYLRGYSQISKQRDDRDMKRRRQKHERSYDFPTDPSFYV